MISKYIRNNALFVILVIVLLLLLVKIAMDHFGDASTTEHYVGLSKVDRFVDMMERKYTKVDRDAKTVTQCIKKKNYQGSAEERDMYGLPKIESEDTNCQTISYKYHFNKEDAIKLVKDKIATSQLLMDAGLPVPKFFKFVFGPTMDNIMIQEKLLEQMNQAGITFPIVLKQIYGTFGIDVFTHIKDIEMAGKTLEEMRNKGYKEVMCEEQIEGHCYRIFVFNGQIMDVIRRSAPFVVGDGVNTIRSLIDMRNKRQLEKKLFETKNVTESFIADQGYKMDDILPKGRNVTISTVINMHNGADIERIPLGSIPEINRNIFIQANQVLGIKCSGIDFLSPDITKSYKENNGRILEINGTPDTEIHTIVSEQSGDNFDIYEKIAANVF